MPSYSGLWNGVNAEAYALQVNRAPVFRRVSMALRRRSSMALREVIDTVANGSSINGAAAVTYKRVAGDQIPGSTPTSGGLRTIETVTAIASSTTVAAGAASTLANVSAAQIDKLVDYQSAPGSAGGSTSTQNYPVDKSGNGGGGRLTAQYRVKGLN
jgi:hypothetical protein